MISIEVDEDVAEEEGEDGGEGVVAGEHRLRLPQQKNLMLTWMHTTRRYKLFIVLQRCFFKIQFFNYEFLFFCI